MSAAIHPYITQRNAQPASADDLAPLAFAGYAHFTAMQVRGGGIRGLDLHLERLRNASLRLFGQSHADAEIRAALRSALEQAPDDTSLMATVYSPAGEFTVAGPEHRPELLVRTSPPSDGPQGPLSLAIAGHERVLPEIKHVGEIAKTWYLREAVAAGFDDAVFTDHRGRFSEATIWNLAFWDGESVIWPRAKMLTGTTMGILQRQLDRLGARQSSLSIDQQDLPRLAGAVVMNSWTPAVPVSRIGDAEIPPAPEFVELLRRAFEAEPRVKP
ncbi:aminotransferase class IV family protein [Pseudomonas sp. PDM20]|uniref:aminotransferase class IV family protein n=1 Tax=Pseudomonas sp. PDM20 TaxID=2769254 RepID=UPI00177EE7CF|nr:aminotransferase class IV family protein [Pseudomonas sp. PDM20]MBD9683746.1 aminotransferase class IV family protein [Pseudomonas sp. PDM20]